MVGLRAVVEEKDAVIQQLQTQVSELDQKLDDLEQYTRRNSLRVSGIPESAEEDCEALTLATLNESLSLEPPLSLADIDRLHRVGRPRTDGKPRQVLVKFATYRQRQRVMKKRPALTDSDLFLNEDLTQKRNHLLWAARVAKRNKRIKDCWSMEGRILIRDLAEKAHHIKTIEDLEVPPPLPATPPPT